MRPIVILGAGLAGLSLADALLDAGVDRPVVLVDRRRSWERDRTWCTWLTGPLRHSQLASHRWSAWRTRRGDEQAVARTARHPYIQVDSRVLYDALLTRLDDARHVEIRCEERVRGVDFGGQRPVVSTSRERFEAELVIDAMGPRSPLLEMPPDGEVALSQRFLGWEVEVDAPVFDPGVATLMDFRPAGDGLQFIYTLPYTPTRALIEHTSIGVGGPLAAQRRAILEAELADLGAGQWRVTHEERGLIPMTTGRFPVARGARGYAVGAAAGAIRPSSGYAFTRIQRHVAAVAAAIAAGRPPPGSVAPGRLALLDRVFLEALAGRRDHGESLLWDLARRVPADPFARFMTDVADRRDEARVIAALPRLPMGVAALSAVAAHRRLVAHP